MKKWISKNWLHIISLVIYAVIFAILIIKKDYSYLAIITLMYLIGYADGYWKGIRN